MQKYIGSDVTSMVTLPVIISEPMTTLQKIAEVHDMTIEAKCFFPFNLVDGMSQNIYCF